MTAVLKRKLITQYQVSESISKTITPRAEPVLLLLTCYINAIVFSGRRQLVTTQPVVLLLMFYKYAFVLNCTCSAH